MNRIKNFIDVLEKLKSSSFEEIKEELEKALSVLDSEQLYIAEQEMIEYKIDTKNIKKLISNRIKSISLETSKVIKSLPNEHPIQLFLKDHKEIINIINKLKNNKYELKNVSEFIKIKNIINEIKQLIFKLIKFEKHEEKEEKLIFPKLEKIGILSHPYIMKFEHQKISESTKKLLELLEKLDEKNYQTFSRKIISLLKDIIKKVNENIFEEEAIIYPLSIKYISSKDWEEIRKNF
jgi:hypothetical protein